MAPPGAAPLTAGAAVVVVALVALPLLCLGLGSPGLDDPGEGMHAEIARELLVSGDPTVLTLNGVRYVDKPPLLYALVAAAYRAAGVTESAARAVAAAGALMAVAATAWLGCRLPAAGVPARPIGACGGALAGSALLGSTLFFVFGRYVRPETLFVGALAGGFALTLVGLTRRDRRLVGAGLVAFGLAGLAKDPLGTLAPLLALALALAAAGRGSDMRQLVPWPALAVALALGTGWWAIAEARTPGALWYTVVDNKVLNVAGARVFPDEDVPLSAVEFLAVALLGAAPWSLGAGAAVADAVRRRAWRLASEIPWTALALWTLGLLALTALSRFRLPHYGLPAYPALALLAARAWTAPRPRGLAAAHAALFAALAVACGAAWLGDGSRFAELVAGATDVATRKSAAAGQAAPFPPWEALRPLVGWAGLAFGAGAIAMIAVLAAWRGCLGRAGHVLRQGGGLAGMAVAVVTMLAVQPAAGSAIALVSDHRSVRGLARFLAERAGPDDVVVHEGPIEATGALEWYSGRRPVLVDGRRSVLGFGATRADARDVFWDAERLRQAWRSGRRVWIVSTRQPARSLAASLPGARVAVATPTRRLYVGPNSPPP